MIERLNAIERFSSIGPLQTRKRREEVLTEHCVLGRLIKVPVRFQPVMLFSEISDDALQDLLKKEDLSEQLEKQRGRVQLLLNP